jgi:hypothetical protein
MFSTVAFCYFLSIILLFSSTVWVVASKPDVDVQMSLEQESPNEKFNERTWTEFTTVISRKLSA